MPCWTDGEFTDDLIGQVETGIIPGVGDHSRRSLRVDLLGTGASAADFHNRPGRNHLRPRPKPPLPLVRFNAEDALAIQVVKQGKRQYPGKWCGKWRMAVADLAPDFPDLTLELATTQANYIREANPGDY